MSFRSSGRGGGLALSDRRPSLESMRRTTRVVAPTRGPPAAAANGTVPRPPPAETDDYDDDDDRYDDYDDGYDSYDDDEGGLLSKRRHGGGGGGDDHGRRKRAVDADGPASRATATATAAATDRAIADEYEAQERTAKRARPTSRAVTPDDLVRSSTGLVAVRHGFSDRFHGSLTAASAAPNRLHPRYPRTVAGMARYSRNLVGAYQDWMDGLSPGLSLQEGAWTLYKLHSKGQVRQALLDMRQQVRNDHVERVLGLEQAEAILAQLADYHERVATDGTHDGGDGQGRADADAGLFPETLVNEEGAAPSRPSADGRAQAGGTDAAAGAGGARPAAPADVGGTDPAPPKASAVPAARPHALDDSSDEEEARFDDDVGPAGTPAPSLAGTTTQPAAAVGSGRRRPVLDDDDDDNDEDEDDDDDDDKDHASVDQEADPAMDGSLTEEATEDATEEAKLTLDEEDEEMKRDIEREDSGDRGGDDSDAVDGKSDSENTPEREQSVADSVGASVVDTMQNAPFDGTTAPPTPKDADGGDDAGTGENQNEADASREEDVSSAPWTRNNEPPSSERDNDEISHNATSQESDVPMVIPTQLSEVATVVGTQLTGTFPSQADSSPGRSRCDDRLRRHNLQPSPALDEETYFRPKSPPAVTVRQLLEMQQTQESETATVLATQEVMMTLEFPSQQVEGDVVVKDGAWETQQG